MKLGVRCLVLAALLSSALEAQPPVYRVVVHSDNPTTELTVAQVSDLFLKKTRKWEHGGAVEPVDLPPGSPVRQAFSRDVHGRPPEQIETFWQQKVFAGEAVTPEKRADDAEVVAFVEGRPGAIGYVSRSAPLGDAVKPLDLVTEPRPVHREPARYPETARRHRVEGVVVVKVTVGTEGQVRDVEVVQGRPGGLTQEAVRALKLWKFEPATRNGEPVEWEVEIPIGFKLD